MGSGQMLRSCHCVPVPSAVASVNPPGKAIAAESAVRVFRCLLWLRGNQPTSQGRETLPAFFVAEIVNYEFDMKDLVCLAMSSVVGVWYLLRKVGMYLFFITIFIPPLEIVPRVHMYAVLPLTCCSHSFL